MKFKVEKFFVAPGKFLEKVSVRQLWKVLVGIAMAIAIAFSGLAAYQIFRYARLGTSAPAKVTDWGVKELSSSQFGVEVCFEFEAAGKSFRGKTLFDSPVYLNPFSAEEAIKSLKKEAFAVWFQSSDPSMCSLQKEFPLKSLVNALVTLGVVFYFISISKKLYQASPEEQARTSPLRIKA